MGTDPLKRTAAPVLVLIAIGLLAVLLPQSAAAGINYLMGLESGVSWFFLYDQDFEEVIVPPQWCYGFHFNVIADFDWARNISLEANYVRSEGRGEIKPNDDRENIQFRMAADRGSLNVSYFFGGAVYDPFISGGLGAVHLSYDPEKEKTEREMDFSVNVGGGLDFKLAKHFLAGARVRYTWILPSGALVHGHASDLDVVLRISARF